jgi:pentatricopeptide repeat protein
MTEMGIKKNVIIFGAAMSCMEKCCRADISFQLMERMKLEGIQPNVHIYNSAISACARCGLWEKGHLLFKEMDEVGIAHDVVSYNAVLDAVASQIDLGRMLFEEGVKKGFYARVSRLGQQWFELDLHFLSLGGGEIALGWWFEECLVPFLMDTSKLEQVNSISIVTGYGKTRTRGRRQGDDGMKKRVQAMLSFMDIYELPQNNAGRIHIDKDRLIETVNRNGGRIIFDLDGYISWSKL